MTITVKETVVPDKIDEIGSGIVCEWYFNEAVAVYKISQMSHALVEQWTNYVVETLEKWDTSQPYLALHDLSKPGISLQYASIVDFDTANIGVTTTGRKRVNQIVMKDPDFLACIALNFSMSLSGQVNRLLAHRSQVQSIISYKLFYNYEKSVEWLASFVRNNSE